MEADPEAVSIDEGAVAPAAAPAAPAASAAQPRMVRRVACLYRLDALPGSWLQTWRRLDRVLDRAHLAVKATLDPVENLPAEADILVVPPELRAEVLEKVKPGTPILVTSAESAAGAFAELVRRLEEGVDVTAERFDPDERKAQPKIVSYRGSTRLD